MKHPTKEQMSKLRSKIKWHHGAMKVVALECGIAYPYFGRALTDNKITIETYNKIVSTLGIYEALKYGVPNEAKLYYSCLGLVKDSIIRSRAISPLISDYLAEGSFSLVELEKVLAGEVIDREILFEITSILYKYEKEKWCILNRAREKLVAAARLGKSNDKTIKAITPYINGEKVSKPITPKPSLWTQLKSLFTKKVTA